MYNYRYGLLVVALVVLLAGTVMVPAAQAGGPVYVPNRGYAYPTYTPNPSYYYPYAYNYSYAPPVVNRYVYPYYTSPAPTYVYPYRSYTAAPTYAFPNRGYAYPSASYGGWGSFGTYDNWARAFYSNHGRYPNNQDVNDYWWSQGFAARNGYSPYQGYSDYRYGNNRYSSSGY